MRIAVRGGHVPKVTGANALIDELTEDRKVKDSVIKYLRQLGCEVYDVTPNDNTPTLNSELAYGVNRSNILGVDLFISIHFNKAYEHYNGALGSEVCVYSTFDIAQRVVDELSKLGFKNRGQKVRNNLYELNRTKMKAMIIEVCFVEASEDVALYKKLGHDLIGKTIALAITNKKISATVETPKNNKPIINNSDNWLNRLQEECNKQGFSGYPTLKKGARGNITKLLQEKLVSLGYNTNGVDGIFGSGTEKAVISFQKAYGLVVDGIVGKNTWRKIINI